MIRSAVRLLALISLAWGGATRAAELHVDSHVDTVDANSKDLVCADVLGRCTLRAAVMQANAIPGGDHIFLPRELPQRVAGFVLAIPGRDEDAAATGDLDLTDDVTIRLEPLSIEGKGAQPKPPEPKLVDGNGLDRVFDVHPGATVVLQHLVIRNGLVEDPEDGGGIRNRGDLTLFGVELRGNGGADWGGGVFSAGLEAALHIQGSEICNNQAEAGGGVFSGQGATLHIHGSEICENHAGAGGGVVNEGTEPGPNGVAEIATSTIRDNRARGAGGGIFNGGILTLIQSTVSSNVVQNPEPAGEIGGGGILNTDHVGIFDSTIAWNISFGRGGGIFSSLPNSVVGLSNSTVRANLSSSGNGLRLEGNGTMAFVANTILAGNAGDDCSIGEDTLAFIVSLGGNLGNPFTNCPFDHPDDPAPAFPELGDLQNNGGPTETYAPLPGSPAIDAANDALCTGFDQRGFPRPQGPHCDIGAVERTTADSIVAILELLLDAGFLPGLDDALAAQLDEADRSLRNANPADDGAGRNALGAFVRLVEAQRGLGIEEEDADTLANLARTVLADLPAPEPSGRH